MPFGEWGGGVAICFSTDEAVGLSHLRAPPRLCPLHCRTWPKGEGVPGDRVWHRQLLRVEKRPRE